MSAEPSSPRRIGPITLPENLGPVVLLLVSGVAIAAVLWGRFVADPGVEVRLFDAGRESVILDQLRADGVVAFPDERIYIVGLEDGRLRAVDGRVEFSGCSVDFLPTDPRGRERNPNGIAGVLEDPCSGAVWSLAGDAISGVDEPLRVPQISFGEDDGNGRHMFVEVITVGDD